MNNESDDTRASDSLDLLSNSQTLAKSRPITIAVDPVALVVTECITVTSAMRKHARWAHSSVSAILGAGPSRLTALGKEMGRDRDASATGSGEDDGALASRWGLRGAKGKSMQDNPLISAFARLRNDMKRCKDVRTFDTPALLHPFLQVIRSSSTSAPITSLALIAVTKMLAYNIISRDSPNLAQGMQLLASALTHCRFEHSDAASDEVVLLRILKLMEGMITGPGGDILSDGSVCEIMECGLSMCTQPRLSEFLRRSAEISLVTMCQTIFERLKTIEVESGDEPQVLEQSLKQEKGAVRMDPSTNGTLLPGKRQESRPSMSLEVPANNESRTSLHSSESQADLVQTSEPDKELEIKPYSLPSILELFRVLVEILDPLDRKYSDTVRVMGLRIINVALEVAGPSIANHPCLASLAKDTMCRHLFQLVRSESIVLLHESLRTAGTLLATCRSVLKLQQELFLSYLVACLHPRVAIPDEPGVDPELYEGVPQAPRLVKPPPSSTASGRSTPVPVKDRQKLGMEGGQRKPDAREAMVESVGALVRIPSFMTELFVNYDCEIDRSDLCIDMVGLLSRNAFPDSATWSTTNVPPLCLDSLLGYIQSIADRLEDVPKTKDLPNREMLRQRRALKQIIIRGTTKFNENPKAGIAFLASQGVIEDPNDPHSITKFLKGTTRIDKKILGEFLSKKTNDHILNAFMELFDFAGQRVDEALRLLLNSFRLPGESQLIERIVTAFAVRYFSTAKPEGIAHTDALFILVYAIIMLNVDQHSPKVKSQNRMSFQDFARNLRDVNDGKPFEEDFLQDIYDAIRDQEIVLPEEHDNSHAFEHAWRELLVKVQSASDLVICDTNVYDVDMFTATWRPIVATLTYVFMSASEDTVFQRVIQAFDQCATIAAKYNLNECIDRIIHCLATISTLATPTPPDTSLNTEIQTGENGQKSIMVSKFAVDFGRDYKPQLATVVLSHIVNGHEAAIRDGWTPIVRVFINLFARDTVILVENITDLVSRLPLQPLKSLILSLLAQIPEDSSPRVMVVKPDMPAPNPVRPNGQKAGPTISPYDPALVYVLELCTLLAIRDEETVMGIGKDVAHALQGVIRDANHVHPVVVGRACYYLFSLLQASGDLDFIRAPVVLHSISSFDPNLLKQCATLVLRGIEPCVKAPSGLRCEMTTSPDFWSILHALQPIPETGPLVFQILEDVVDGTTVAINVDNFGPTISLLNAFATAGSVGAGQEQRREQAGRRSKAPPPDRRPKNSEAVARGTKAMSILYSLTSRVPHFIEQSHLEAHDAWAAHWSPIFRCLITQCTNPCRDIRQQAFSSLQRCLLSKDLASPDHNEWTKIFGEVLFPLMHQLLKPEVYSSDPTGMAETRVQAAQLVCRIFLHYLVLLSEWEGMLDLWVKILEVMDRLMNSGQRDSLEEAVPESLKNVLLVMSSGGYLAPPSEDTEQTEQQQQLWHETWMRLNRFLPGLMPELFPDVASVPPQPKRKEKSETTMPPTNGVSSEPIHPTDAA
ncbi:GDP/GTP exchange factor for ARF [Elasticomyces elasticus]|nr:GDP/GTP exchange factor for ARF [Elasticomyces elasticus]